MSIPRDRYSNSWVVTSKKSGNNFETYNEVLVQELLGNENLLVETAYQYLTRINREIKEAKSSDSYSPYQEIKK